MSGKSSALQNVIRSSPKIFGLALIVLSLFWVIPLPERMAACDSRMVNYRSGLPAHLTLSCDDKWRMDWVLGETDPRYLKALVQLEDKRFWWHAGIDPLSIARAAWQNLKARRVKSGGSTLTMQVVRVLEPRPRTFLSKLLEAWRAVQLEMRFSKSEILELYLRFAPFGRNLEGIAAASMAYFGHLPQALSFEETLVLLAVPQDPSRRYPELANQARLKAAVEHLATRLKAWKFYEDVKISGSAIQIPMAMKPFPKEIPHAALGLLARFPKDLRLTTSIDAGTQRLAETLLGTLRADLAQRQIHNATVLVLDSASSEVRAAIGNFDFWDRAHGGQIAGFWVERSPGSALKPVLHAMGLDRRLFTPATLVPDVPVNFSGFAPKNFNQKFNGLVSMEDALAHSLNIPFVTLLSKIGVEEFITVLRRMGVRSPDTQQGRYGLSAIIGGIEITPEEMAGVYATLARGGNYLPVQWFSSPENAVKSKAIPIFDAGSTWLTAQTLALRERPDFPNRRTVSDATGGVHWKTGTSFGLRDAWAVGFGKKHTAIVWMGNFDNSSSSALVGSHVAAPLLFDLLEALDGRNDDAHAASRPSNVGPLEVCAFSGLPVGDACEQKRTVLSLMDKIPAERCPYHVHVDVDLNTQLALTPMCRIGRNYERRTFMRLPTEVRRWLSDTSQNLPHPPKLAAFCTKPQGTRKAKIISPDDGQIVLLMSGLEPDQQKIPLEAELPPDSEEVSWFVNGQFLGTTSDHERLWWVPKVGDHEIAVSVDNGQVSRRKFKVRVP